MFLRYSLGRSAMVWFMLAGAASAAGPGDVIGCAGFGHRDISLGDGAGVGGTLAALVCGATAGTIVGASGAGT